MPDVFWVTWRTWMTWIGTKTQWLGTASSTIGLESIGRRIFPETQALYIYIYTYIYIYIHIYIYIYIHTYRLMLLASVLLILWSYGCMNGASKAKSATGKRGKLALRIGLLASPDDRGKGRRSLGILEILLLIDLFFIYIYMYYIQDILYGCIHIDYANPR